MLRAGFVALVLGGFGLAAPSVVLAAGSISGTVTAAAAPNDPLAGVEVCAYRLMSYEIKCTSTGSSGEYTVADLVDGSYSLEFLPDDSSNYVPQYFEEKFSSEEADIVDVEGGDIPNIDAALGEGGWIEGRVFDSVSKAGVIDVRVCASPLNHYGFSRCVFTGSSGDYMVQGLATGSYMVGFVPKEGGASVDYLWQFYEGKDSWFEPTPVAVSVGSGTTGIDAPMERGSGIGGTVTDATSGAAISSSRVCLFILKENLEPDCTQTDPGGHYSFDRLSSGFYKVWFSPDVPMWYGEEDDYFQQYYSAKATLAQSDAVLVGADEVVSGIDARLVSRKPAPPALSAPPLIAARPVKLHKPCGKGKRKVKRRGRVRCVKAHRHHRHRSGRRREPL